MMSFSPSMTACLIASRIGRSVVFMTAAFFGLSQLRGLGWGTLVCALVTGTCVGWFNRRLEARFQFRPAFPNLEKFFTPNTPSSSTEF